MCSYFWQRVENCDQGGDLGDIIRSSSVCGGATVTTNPTVGSEWQSPLGFSDDPSVGFGDPFSNLRDPLLPNLPGESFSDIQGDKGMAMDGGGGSNNLLDAQKILGTDEIRPCNVFSRVLQISPGVAKGGDHVLARGIRPTPILVGDHMMKLNNNLSCCSMDHSDLQISSPRTPGIKRRKSQAKKVVCIPAPAAAGSRPSGEVVPSDLWAWRKYGQKPIKGSPYPRGYYRCSSSKGCSARKQVERSRTDPNMLVITYTSEHNHPWPTQRNALAGSTRTQPIKTNTAILPKQSLHSSRPPQVISGEEQVEPKQVPNTSGPVKEEDVEMEKAPIDAAINEYRDLDHILTLNYKPMFPELSNHGDDFFVDLGELEPDPMELVFSKGFMEDKPEEQQQREDKTLDNFGNIFDWGGNTLGEGKN